MSMEKAMDTSQVCKEEKQSKLETAGNVQARTFSGVSVFGGVAREVTETKSSLIALQELASHQELVENQVQLDWASASEPTKN